MSSRRSFEPPRRRTEEEKHRDALLERSLRKQLSRLYNGVLSNSSAEAKLAQYPKRILINVLMDTFNRVDGCFRFNETFFYGEYND